MHVQFEMVWNLNCIVGIVWIVKLVWALQVAWEKPCNWYANKSLLLLPLLSVCTTPGWLCHPRQHLSSKWAWFEYKCNDRAVIVHKTRQSTQLPWEIATIIDCRSWFTSSVLAPKKVTNAVCWLCLNAQHVASHDLHFPVLLYADVFSAMSRLPYSWARLCIAYAAIQQYFSSHMRE